VSGAWSVRSCARRSDDTNGTSFSVSHFLQRIWACIGHVSHEQKPIMFILFLVDYSGNIGRLDEALGSAPRSREVRCSQVQAYSRLAPKLVPFVRRHRRAQGGSSTLQSIRRMALVFSQVVLQ
jgi:hypothetical protein